DRIREVEAVARDRELRQIGAGGERRRGGRARVPRGRAARGGVDDRAAPVAAAGVAARLRRDRGEQRAGDRIVGGERLLAVEERGHPSVGGDQVAKRGEAAERERVRHARVGKRARRERVGREIVRRRRREIRRRRRRRQIGGAAGGEAQRRRRLGERERALGGVARDLGRAGGERGVDHQLVALGGLARVEVEADRKSVV